MTMESARPASATNNLHKADDYAWTQHQAVLLRKDDLGHIDLVDILEEIGTLGRLMARLSVADHAGSAPSC